MKKTLTVLAAALTIATAATAVTVTDASARGFGGGMHRGGGHFGGHFRGHFRGHFGHWGYGYGRGWCFYHPYAPICSDE